MPPGQEQRCPFLHSAGWLGKLPMGNGSSLIGHKPGRHADGTNPCGTVGSKARMCFCTVRQGLQAALLAIAQQASCALQQGWKAV